jgi:chromosome segregation ATPase
VSWKHSFGRLNEEYELARKKKQALGSLLDAGKISSSTHSLFTREIDEAVAEIDNQRKALLGRMGTKSMELEEQIRTLEILLANFEIEHVAGDVDDETYNRETELLCTGLDMAKKELEEVQVAMTRLSTDEGTSQEIEEPSLPAAEPEPPFVSQATEALQNEQPPPQEPAIEPVQCKEAQPTEPEPPAEEKQQS